MKADPTDPAREQVRALPATISDTNHPPAPPAAGGVVESDGAQVHASEDARDVPAVQGPMLRCEFCPSGDGYCCVCGGGQRL